MCYKLNLSPRHINYAAYSNRKVKNVEPVNPRKGNDAVDIRICLAAGHGLARWCARNMLHYAPMLSG